MVSPYMPDVKVEIAWDGGFRIPMADWTWTDVSEYVELDAGLSINGGRGDERSTADANTLTLTFDNSDGRFTAGRVTGAYYPDVVLYKPIRVLATPVDGAESERFTGYITSWPVEWEDTDAYAKVTITAASRLARLGLNARWRSIIEQTVLEDSPLIYYPLGEPEGSTMAADVSGNAAAPLTMAGDGTAVVFGQATGPGTDDLTAATFQGGKYLTGPQVTLSGEVTLEAWFSRAGVPGPFTLEVIASFGAGLLNIQMNPSGQLIVGDSITDHITTTDSYADAATHHVVVTVSSGGTWTLYVDGVSVDTAAGGTISGSGSLRLGHSTQPFNIVFYSVLVLTGVVAHAAVYDYDLTSARVAAHTSAGTSAWAGETTDARFERYANMAGIDSAEIDAEAGVTTMGHIDTTSQNVVDLLRLTEATEAGVIFDGRDGTLTMHSRSHRYAATAAVTLDMAKHEVEADYSPRLDASALVNDITVTGVVQAVKVDEASIEANGLATASLTTASEDNDEPANLAAWALLQFATPKPRVPTLSVNATAQAAAFEAGTSTVSSADVMAVTIGDKVTVANHPQQASVSITDYFVEGWAETYGPESLTITWNVSPSSPDDQALIVGDPLRGVVGTNYVAL